MNCKYFFIILCMILGINESKAQGFVIDSVKYGPDTVYIKPDVSATFPGGREKIYDYIEVKFDMYEDPGSMTGGPNQGTMEVDFVVETTGRVKYVYVTKSVSAVYDEEMTRALIAMPKWQPAMVNGKKVRSLQSIRYTLKFYQR